MWRLGLACRYTLSGRDEKTLMKLIVHVDTDIVVGVHMWVRTGFSWCACCFWAACVGRLFLLCLLRLGGL